MTEFTIKIIKRVLFFCLLFSASLFAREKIAIAVLDFEPKNVNEGNAEAVTDLLRTELFNTGAFKVVERQTIQKILDEQRFQMSGMTDTDEAAELGRLLNVQKIMVGSLTRLGSTYIINTRIVDVQSGLVSLAEAAECRGGEEKLPGAITELALKIYYKVGLEGALIRVERDEIYMDLGQADGVKLGQYFDVIRKGEVITDLEGRVIGTSQETVGTVLVTKVQDRFSIASVLNPQVSLRKGDLVRPASGDPPPPPVEKKPERRPEPKKEPDKKEKSKDLDLPAIF